MEISRNQYYLIGLVILFVGIQFHAIDTIELTPELTQFLAERSGQPVAAVSAARSITQPLTPSGVKKTVRPPEWLGWSLMSIGAVLILHSWAMKKPGT
jgi:hypothetical protein